MKQQAAKITKFEIQITMHKRIIVLFILSLCLLSQQSKAQQWTIQTAAYQNTEEANKKLADLNQKQLDAYLEQALVNNKTITRVRLGCFDSKETAQQFVSLMGLVGSSPVLRTNSSGQQLCRTRLVGAQLPSAWGTYQMNSQRYDAWFQMANQTAYLSFEDQQWSLSSEGRVLEDNGESIETKLFYQNAETIMFQYPGFKPSVLSMGKLIWQHETSVILIENNSIVAYYLSNP